MMKTKHRLLGLLMFGAIIALLAYSAGARHNQLSSQQMSFSSLSSNQNNNQLKAHMRDALISKLNTRASNHELRIATYAQSSSHPQLSSQQLSFNSYLSTNNNNMLTAHMWDNLTAHFATTISNHEMRIRCIEDGACLNTSHCPTTPSNPINREAEEVERITTIEHSSDQGQVTITACLDTECFRTQQSTELSWHAKSAWGQTAIAVIPDTSQTYIFSCQKNLCEKISVPSNKDWITNQQALGGKTALALIPGPRHRNKTSVVACQGTHCSIHHIDHNARLFALQQVFSYPTPLALIPDGQHTHIVACQGTQCSITKVVNPSIYARNTTITEQGDSLIINIQNDHSNFTTLKCQGNQCVQS